jgi:hypothetical protein
MKRASGLIATASMFAITPLLLAQSVFAQNEPPTLPSDILGPQLIVWSQQQNPEPVLQSSVSEPARRPPEVRTFTGRIMKGHAGYFLQLSSDVIYQLDNRELCASYERKVVEVIGTQDKSGGSIRVASIHLIS